MLNGKLKYRSIPIKNDYERYLMDQKEQRKHIRVSIFVSHLGCPHDCAYCNQEKITGFTKAVYRSVDEIKVEIERQLATIDGKQNHVEIAFFGGNFTGLPISYQRDLLELAKEFVEEKGLEGIRFSTRPDAITEEILQFLSPYPIRAIELGVQSLDIAVLERSRRGHSPEDVYRAVALLKETPIQVGIQIMCGLPGDTEETFTKTVKEVIALKPDFVRIYPTLVFTGTDLANWYREGSYQPWSLEETIDNVANVLPLFYETNIPIIRLGLQEKEDFQREDTILAGPHHPSIRQLVESRYFYNQLERVGANHQLSGTMIEITIHPTDETALRGKGNSNIKQFQDKYHCIITIIRDSKLEKKQLLVQIKRA